MQKSYKTPEVSIISLETEDIVSTSLIDGGENGDASVSFSFQDEFLS